MRVPPGRLYRGFPELDVFPDAECEWYIRRAMQRHAISMAGMGVVAVLTALAVTVGTGLLEVWAIIIADRRVPGGEALGMGIVIVGIVIPIATGLVAGWLVRDVWLRAMLRVELKLATCPNCDYLLLGVPTHEDMVRCPECGVNSQIPLPLRPASPQPEQEDLRRVGQ